MPSPQFHEFKRLLPRSLFVGHHYFLRLENGEVIGFRVDGVNADEGILMQPFDLETWEAVGHRLPVPAKGSVKLSSEGVAFVFDNKA